MTRTTARGWWASLAAVVLVAFVIQLWVAVDVPGTPRAHAVGTLAGAPLASRFIRVLSFFTVQSNILSGVICAVLALAPDRDGSRWRPVRLASLFGITVTGIVYATVLARIHEPHGWRETVANTVFHYIVPIMMVLGWLMFGPRPRIDIRTVGLALLWPVAWITYTLIHGAFSSWYPYPFVDVITHGYARVLLNGALVVVVLANRHGAVLGRGLAPAHHPDAHGTAARQPLDVANADGSGGRQVPRSEHRSHKQQPGSLGLVDESVGAHPPAPPTSADTGSAVATGCRAR